ncbi:uncharacterized protein BDR25DRAFT_361814 [Lindgomyces ingoldianus]|uniref:Uncharacterized protein n=1 Tax=Lindgomyces ingoldianus TaxID=673940 RepID=A0ACB6QBS6_9PLEO|nr:uncharacterized protein BDR25DRAFT_361814 [Lindgomyces ingoldianus]KAF2464310.1 hypothetical protein BDR25DRAFT_361814 [Lindgomyces ingoldianus]
MAFFVVVVKITQPGPPVAPNWGSLLPSPAKLEFTSMRMIDKDGFAEPKLILKHQGASFRERCLDMTVARIFQLGQHAALLAEEPATAFSVDWTELGLIKSKYKFSENEENIPSPDAPVRIQRFPGRPKAEVLGNISYSIQLALDMDAQQELNLFNPHNLNWALITIENQVSDRRMFPFQGIHDSWAVTPNFFDSRTPSLQNSTTTDRNSCSAEKFFMFPVLFKAVSPSEPPVLHKWDVFGWWPIRDIPDDTGIINFGESAEICLDRVRRMLNPVIGSRVYNTEQRILADKGNGDSTPLGTSYGSPL